MEHNSENNIIIDAKKEANRAYHRAYSKKKRECVCGKIVSTSRYYTHLNTNIHKKNIERKEFLSRTTLPPEVLKHDLIMQLIAQNDGVAAALKTLLVNH